MIRLDGPILLTNPFYELPEMAMRRTADVAGLDGRIDQLRAGQSSGV